MANILIVGASSAIAAATAREWAKQRASLYLVGRDREKLDALKADLEVRGAAAVFVAEFSAADFSSHKALVETAAEAMSGIDVALIAHGSLSDQALCQQDISLAVEEHNTNAVSYFSLLESLAGYMEPRKQGVIAAIGSVAGDRGRQSNYIYGAAKGAVAVYMQGLRQRLQKSQVGVVMIKPGFVDTPMTSEFKKGLLWAQPESVAENIVAAIEKRKDVVYTPWFWRWIMLIIKLIPEAVFKRISL